MRECAPVIVTEALAGGREVGGGGPAGIHIVPCLFKVYASFTYYHLPGEIPNLHYQSSE